MVIKPKLYPYPVLRAKGDDYINGKFVCDFKQNRGMKKTIIQVAFNMDNKGLYRLVHEEKAEFVVHVECALTSFRQVFSSKDPIFSFDLEDNALVDKVNLCPFLVAKTDIPNYTNPDFDDDYQDCSFSFVKGNILAIGVQQSFKVEKDQNDLASVPSIFKIYPKQDKKDKTSSVDLNEDYIKIALTKEDYTLYQSQSKLNTATVNAFLIFPTLIYALECLKEGFEDMEELKWVQALKLTLKKNGYTLNQDLLDLKSSFELAQILMMQPLTGAFNEIEERFHQMEED